MKKFILKSGKTIINITAYLWLMAIVLFAIGAIFADNSQFNVTLTIWGSCLLALISFVVSYFLIYLLMDINDNLIEINKKTSFKLENVNERQDENDISDKTFKNNDSDNNFINKGIYKK